MWKSDRLFCLLLLNLLLGFSCGDQTVVKGGGDEGEVEKTPGEYQTPNNADSKQPKETEDDASSKLKIDGADQKNAEAPQQAESQKDVTLPPENTEPKTETQAQEVVISETQEKTESSVKPPSSDNTDSGLNGAENQESGNVEKLDPPQQDNSEKVSENTNEQKNEIQSESVKKEVPDSSVVPTEGEQKLPMQPDGSSSQTQTEVVPLTSEPKVKEDEKDFETFSEWRQKALAEEEKNKQKVEVIEQGVSTPKKQNGKKVNYASKECGAKILASNPEAENVDRILTNNRDEYMINPCAANKKWFVIELCEPIYVNEIEAGSYELFSSQPQNISVNVSDRYPAKEYHSLGVFHLTESRGLDKFQVKREHNFFVKYVKVELLTHYGEEHFCPLTMFRVYGIPVELDDDDDLVHHPEEGEQLGDNAEASDTAEGVDSNQPKNLFSSAKDTVMKLVKKVLNVEEKTEQLQQNNSMPLNATSGSNNATEGNQTTPLDKMKPCEPNVNVPKEKGDSEPVKNGGSQPEPPVPTSCPAHQEKHCDTPGKVTDEMKPDLLDPAVSIVTKLEDHEQVPSEELKPEQVPSEELKPPMVSLIQSGDHAKPLSLYRMFLTCILPGRFKIRRRHNSTLSMCGYVKALREDWVCVPGQFTLPSTCMSRSRTQESSMGTASKTEDKKSVELAEVTSSPSSDVVETSTQREEETQSPCFVPTPASTTANDIPTVTQVTSIELEATVIEGEVTHQETKTKQDPLPPPSPVLSTSQNTMDKTETVEVKTTASVPVESTQTVEVPSAVVSTAHTDVESSGPVLEPSIVIEGGTTAATTQTPQLQQTESLTTTPVSQESSLPAPSSTTAADDTKTEPKMHLPEVNVASISTSSSAQMESSQDSVPLNGQILEEDDRETSEGDRETPTPAPVVSDTPLTKSESNFPISADDIQYTPQKNLRLERVPMMSLQKRETAIMRLTNRIKALETNVSLSSRFLDEMTQKFKKQSEEMQKLLNAKFENVTKDLKDAELKDQQQQEQINILEHRLDNLTDLMYKLHDEMFTLNKQVTDRQVYFTSVEVFVLVCVLLICRRRGRTSVTDMPPEVRRLIEKMPPNIEPPRSPRRNSYTEGAGRQGRALLSVGGNLQKHNSDSSLAHQISVASSASSTSQSSADQQRDFQKKKKKKKNKIQLPKSSEIQSLPKELKTVDTTNHSEAGLLFTSNKPKEHSSNSKPERRSSGGFLSFLWKNKSSTNREMQKRISCPDPLPSVCQSGRPVSSIGPKMVRKSSSMEGASQKKESPNGHCVYVYPVNQIFKPPESGPRPLSGQYSGRPPDKNSAGHNGHAKKRTHKRASSEDFSPRKGEKSSSLW